MTDTTMTAGSKMSPQTRKRLALGGGAAGLLAALSILGAQLSSSSHASGGSGTGTGGTSTGNTVTLSAPAPALVAPDWVHQVDRSLGSLHTEVDGIQKSLDKVNSKLDQLDGTLDRIFDALAKNPGESIR